MKKLLTFLLAALTAVSCAFALTACDSRGSFGKKIKIAVLQYAEHGSLDNCYQGLKEGLAEKGYGADKVSFNFKNAKGIDADNTTYANSLINGNPAVAVGIATPSAYALANASKGDVPVVFTAVSDPYAESMDFRKFENLTGSSDKLPVENQIDLIRSFYPADKIVKIGIVYSLSEANSVSQIAEFEAFEAEKNIEIVTQGINAATDIPGAVDTLIGKKVDCLNNLTDNKVVQNLNTVLDRANGAKIPVFGSEIEQVEKGCLASCSLDYVELGRRTGYMIADILNGKKADEIEYLFIEDGYTVDYNSEVLKTLGMTLADAYKDANDVKA
ncbi:ABC transporter substrate-binding protein [Candidatus Borkfalkia ceftriaxoniphila]|uniref:ABC transporter substrate-binding protein n=1 Tax=Candidatus Borkfalkia ceftriaxoniphila TaxID=2508949 RepID=A0A4Q2KCC6_9FIRM|nr:ABC transporter substrate-binding protein [Candidatus Borkfalkia ceftriaxoniphila]RXZ62244.1 ABC transporter substrate-binding protein [Candidatus Borkfalkia ceftriaxoniphila]